MFYLSPKKKFQDQLPRQEKCHFLKKSSWVLHIVKSMHKGARGNAILT